MASNGNEGNPSDPGSWNKYAYVEDDPINGTDPKGLFEEPVGGTIGGSGLCTIDGVPVLCSEVPCDTLTGETSSGFPCPVFPIFEPIQKPSQPKLPPPPVFTLQEIGDCIYPNGTGQYSGFVLYVEYQVFMNGKPLTGNTTLNLNPPSKTVRIKRSIRSLSATSKPCGPSCAVS